MTEYQPVSYTFVVSVRATRLEARRCRSYVLPIGGPFLRYGGNVMGATMKSVNTTYSVTQLSACLGWGYFKTREAILRGDYGLELVENDGRLAVTRASGDRAIKLLVEQQAPPQPAA